MWLCAVKCNALTLWWMGLTTYNAAWALYHIFLYKVVEPTKPRPKRKRIKIKIFLPTSRALSYFWYAMCSLVWQWTAALLIMRSIMHGTKGKFDTMRGISAIRGIIAIHTGNVSLSTNPCARIERSTELIKFQRLYYYYYYYWFNFLSYGNPSG